MFTLYRADNIIVGRCHNVSDELVPAHNGRRHSGIMWDLNKRRNQRKLKYMSGVHAGPTSVNGAIQVVVPIIYDPTVKSYVFYTSNKFLAR